MTPRSKKLLALNPKNTLTKYNFNLRANGSRVARL